MWLEVCAEIQPASPRVDTIDLVAESVRVDAGAAVHNPQSPAA